MIPVAEKRSAPTCGAYRSNDFELGPRIIVFDYQTSRKVANMRRDFLNGWQGHLVVDTTPVTNRPVHLVGNCTELGCWAHARRKFFDLHQANASTVAFEALQRIGKLYAAEAEGKHLSTEARQQLRAEKSLPILQSLHDWLLQTRAQTADGGGTAKAIDFPLKRWQSLIRYASSGHLPITTTRRKNTIRPIALGKKTGCSPVLSAPETSNAPNPYSGTAETQRPQPRYNG
ncbi:MAG: IS66 family transposase [Nitrosomonas sp.]|nr:IS66 family transposase [Nitrosomonas sp.]